MNFTGFKTNRTELAATVFSVIILSSMVTGCGGHETGSSSQGYKGVINLDTVKLGIPEEGAKGAPLTFGLDTNPSDPNFVQYLSRVYDKNHGQYCLIYNKGLPKSLRVVYATEPITKEQALEKLKSIMPAGAPEETNVDDSQLKSGKKDETAEIHWFGPNLKGEIIYTDKTATKVKLVSIGNQDRKGKGAKGADAAAPEGGKDAAPADKKAE